MVERHRLNLSLSGPDYQRLVELSELAGRTPTTLALDVLKSFMHTSAAILPAKRAVAPRVVESTVEPDLPYDVASLENDHG